MTDTTIRPGLEGVVAAETRISGIDGEKGELIIGGFAVEDLAPQAEFEEVAYLLWHERVPAPEELRLLRSRLTEARQLPDATLRLLEIAAREQTPAMDALRMAAATLSLRADEAHDAGRASEVAGLSASGAEIASADEAISILARFPTIVAAYWRLLQGQQLVDPRADLGHAANYLYMLTGVEPSAERVRALETYWNTVVDHGLNASTFAARVIVATGSDLISAITGAVCALKGPLHGGAPGPALDMVFEIGSPDRAEAVLRQKLERGERLMGFGHRIYKVRDPRADVLGIAAERLYAADAERALYGLALHVERTALRLLEEYKPGRHLQTNVEFYTALLLHGLDLPAELFTPTFAIARAAGWIAHCLEQRRLGRIIRPQSVYVGERARRWPGGRR